MKSGPGNNQKKDFVEKCMKKVHLGSLAIVHNEIKSNVKKMPTAHRQSVCSQLWERVLSLVLPARSTSFLEHSLRIYVCMCMYACKCVYTRGAPIMLWPIIGAK